MDFEHDFVREPSDISEDLLSREPVLFEITEDEQSELMNAEEEKNFEIDKTGETLELNDTE